MVMLQQVLKDLGNFAARHVYFSTSEIATTRNPGSLLFFHLEYEVCHLS